MSHERSGRSVGAAERYCQLNASSEMRDAVFKEVIRHLHDAGGMLYHSNFWVLVKLADSVRKTILRNTSIRVDDEDIRPTAKRFGVK